MAVNFKNFAKEAKIFGKYLDQPALIKKASNTGKYGLIGGAAAYGLYDSFKGKDVTKGRDTKNKRLIKNTSILGFTVASALIFGKKFIHLPELHVDGKGFKAAEVKAKGNKVLSELISKVKKGEILKRKEVKTLHNGLQDEITIHGEKKKLIDAVIPTGHHHHNEGKPKTKLGEFVKKNPEFGEIKDLSVFGAIPVAAGITGGALGDAITGENVGENLPNKVKEGAYQYLANIVLCNVGAAAALVGLKSAGINSKGAKFVGMIGGILAVGVLGGSAIANTIGKKVINPLFGKEEKCPRAKNNLYSERKPEALDVALHVDDVASAGFLSGVNIIAPVLPALYSVSAYRAGVGYRNNEPIRKHRQANRMIHAHNQNIKTNKAPDTFNNFRRKMHNHRTIS